MTACANCTAMDAAIRDRDARIMALEKGIRKVFGYVARAAYALDIDKMLTEFEPATDPDDVAADIEALAAKERA